ncbi:MAG: hypothetical protein NTZ40_07935 [Cyanobacteria bacterium]|nr:hypothetical protein [Cyanobacteriota bacterium]
MGGTENSMLIVDSAEVLSSNYDWQITPMQLNAGMAKLHPRFSAKYSYPLRRRLSTAEERRLVSEQETARCYYTAMRFEINQHLQIINQIYTLYLAGTTALFVASMSKEGNYNLLLLVPFLSLGAANLLGSRERNIGCIAAYCSNELDKILQKNGASITQWDNSFVLHELRYRNFNSDQVASLMLVAAPGIVAWAISIFKFYKLVDFPFPKFPLVFLGWLAGLVCICCTVLIIILTARYRKRMIDLHRSCQVSPWQ